MSENSSLRISDGWEKTACVLCSVNCGLEVKLEGRRITRVRGNKDHVASHGYACEKAQRIVLLSECKPESRFVCVLVLTHEEWMRLDSLRYLPKHISKVFVSAKKENGSFCVTPLRIS